MGDAPFQSPAAVDTTAEADDVQLRAYRRLSGAERVAIAFRLTDMVRSLAMAGIRRRHPAYDDTEVRIAWQRLVLGDDLIRRVFPDREPIDP